MTGFLRHILLGVLLMLISFGVSGCNRPLSPESYIKWIENPKNGLRKSKSMGPVIYTIQYKTPDYIMLKNNAWNEGTNNRNSSIHYFGLTLNPVDKKSQLLYINLSNEQEYYARMQYYNFDFKKDIELNINGNLLPCEYYFFENNGKITPELTFTLGFDTQGKTGDLQLVINDRVFGNGGINFLFKEKTVNNLPRLKNKS